MGNKRRSRSATAGERQTARTAHRRLAGGLRRAASRLYLLLPRRAALQLVQQWLHEAGVDYPRITGGYKALRNYLLGVLTQSAALPMALVGGNTGSGKTLLVNELADGVDLEGAARHRGSSLAERWRDRARR